MAALGDALMVSTQADSRLNANSSGDGNDGRVSNFVTLQSFGTFFVASSVLKTIWELAKALFGSGRAASYWTPFAICLVYAAWQFLISVFGEKPVKGKLNIVSAGVIGFANAGILAASIIGLTETTGVGETT